MQSSWFSELFRLLVLPLQYELVREDTISILGEELSVISLRLRNEEAWLEYLEEVG